MKPTVSQAPRSPREPDWGMADAEDSQPGKRSSLRAFVGLKLSASRAKAKVVQRREAQGKTVERGSIPTQPPSQADRELGQPKGSRISSGARYTVNAFKSLIPGRSGKNRCARNRGGRTAAAALAPSQPARASVSLTPSLAS